MCDNQLLIAENHQATQQLKSYKAALESL